MRAILYAIPVALLAACASGNATETERHLSGVEGTRSFAASGFDKVSLRGSDNVIVRVGPAASVVAKGDTAVLDELEVKVVDGELRIGRKDHRGVHWRDHGGSATVTVTLPRLVGATVAGSGDMKVDRAEANSFEATVAGSGNLDIGSLTAQAAELAIAGSGNARIAGSSKSLDLSIAGSGDADAAAFRTENADISIAGSGNAQVAVAGEADVSIIGSGDVQVTGGGKCSVTKLGSGQVRCG